MDKEGIKKVFNIIFKILSYIALIVLFSVAVLLVFYIITNQIARSTGKAPIAALYTIVSPSMEPEIKVYDVILSLRIEDEDDLKVGDVITFYSDVIDTGGYTVTHRIHEIKEVDGEKKYITKGDNNQVIDDGTITMNNIVGKVHYVFPQLGKVQFFLSSRLGWICVILIPAIGIIIMDFIKLRKIFNIKKEIEVIPMMKEVEEVREKEENKKVRAVIEKARRFNKNR